MSNKGKFWMTKHNTASKRSGWSLEKAWVERRFDIVEELVCLGANFNRITRNGRSLLYDAVIEGQISLIKLLLFKGARIDGRNEYGNTPLISACWENIPQAVDILIDHGADVNLTTDFRRLATPLFIASQEGHLEVVKALLQRGAIVDKPRMYDTTPLLMACFQEKWDVAKVLLEHGARGDHRDVDGQTPIHVACMKKASASIVELMLLKGTPVDLMTHENRRTPLHLACENNNTDIAELLLLHGAQVNSSDKLRFTTTPLFEASRCGHEDIVNLLLKHGARVDDGCMETGDTPLFQACTEGHLSVAKILVANGAYVNSIRGNDGATPLFVACRHGHERVADFLLGSGADVNHERLTDGETPLSMVARNVQPDIMILLLSRGARVSAPVSEDIRHVLFRCCRNKFGAEKSAVLAKMLLFNGADTLSPHELPGDCSPDMELIVCHEQTLVLYERLWLMGPLLGSRVRWSKIGVGKAFAKNRQTMTVAISVILKSMVEHEVPWNIQVMILKKMIAKSENLS